MTNVPKITWTSTGPVAPTDAEILAGVIADFQTAFGNNMNPSLETPQGQLASSQAAIISDAYAQVIYVANQMDPAKAAGRFQDGIGRIYFQDRIAGTGSIVQTTCAGLAGTVIAIGSLAQDQNGNIWSVTTAGTLDSTGHATVYFTAQNTGPTPIPTSMTIYESINGWESVTPVSGTVGRNVETRAQFEYRRQNSVQKSATGPVGAVRAAVLAVSGVVDVLAYDNKTSASVTYKGVSIAANSMYVAAVGGNQTDIANAILGSASAGCGYTGTTTVTVSDTSYPDPKPAYDISFTVPTDVPLYFDVSIRADSSLPSNINTLIQDAMIAAAAGSGSSPLFRIGYSVYGADFTDAVKGADTNVRVISIKVGTAASPTTDYVDFNADQYPSISAANITVTQV